MRVLAVDTTTARGSIAVVEGEEILAELRVRTSQGHSARLLPGIAFLLGSLGLSPRDIEAYAVTTGPGSFTALRVGISTVQGLALGGGCPCVGVSALDVLAARIAGTADTLVALMDAYRGDVYACFYDREANPRGPAILASPAQIIERSPAGAAFVGDGVAAHHEEITSRVEGPGQEAVPSSLPELSVGWPGPGSGPAKAGRPAICDRSTSDRPTSGDRPREDPPLTDPPLPIDTGGQEDVEALLSIERECSSHPWTLEHLRQAVGGPTGSRVLVLRRPGDGSSEIVAYCAYQIVLDELHIHNLAVRLAQRRRGHARRLLAACLGEGVRAGAQRALLEVRAGNREALTLYCSSGFARVGLRRGYYTEPGEDAVVLERPIA